MAAVRANTMQTTTRIKILNDGQPFAATMSAPRANGSAKTVCEKRINRRKRDTEPPTSIRSSDRCMPKDFYRRQENEGSNWAYESQVERMAPKPLIDAIESEYRSSPFV